MIRKQARIAIGNNELGRSVSKGDVVIHTHPDGRKEESVVEYGIGTDGNPCPLLAFYTLNDGRSFMAGVNGRLLSGVVLKRGSSHERASIRPQER